MTIGCVMSSSYCLKISGPLKNSPVLNVSQDQGGDRELSEGLRGSDRNLRQSCSPNLQTKIWIEFSEVCDYSGIFSAEKDYILVFLEPFYSLVMIRIISWMVCALTIY